MENVFCFVFEPFCAHLALKLAGKSANVNIKKVYNKCDMGAINAELMLSSNLMKKSSSKKLQAEKHTVKLKTNINIFKVSLPVGRLQTKEEGARTRRANHNINFLAETKNISF